MSEVAAITEVQGSTLHCHTREIRCGCGARADSALPEGREDNQIYGALTRAQGMGIVFKGVAQVGGSSTAGRQGIPCVNAQNRM